MMTTADNRAIRVKRLGPRQGRAVVFVHGAGLNGEAWGILPRLCAAAGFRALAVDLPGHGGSDGPAPPSIEAMADWLIQMLAALEVDRPVLVGHSMGALVTLHAAAGTHRPLGGLVLLGAGLRMPVNDRLLQAAKDAPRDAAALIARWAFRDGRPVGRNPMPTSTLRMAARRLFDLADPGVLAADLSACNRYDQAGRMAASIRTPTLVVIGGADRMTPPESGRALVARIPDARAVTIAACGHMAMAEAPRQVHTALITFAKEHQA